MALPAVVRDALDPGLTEHVDPAMTGAGFIRRARSATYRRSLTDLTQSLTFTVSRRAGRPVWQLGARFEVEAPAVRDQMVALCNGMSAFRREGVASAPTYSFAIENVWGIASGAWYVLPEGVPEFMAKVAGHLSTKILPLMPAFASIATLASDGVPAVLGRSHRDPLMVAACRVLCGDVVGARAALVDGYDVSTEGNEWVRDALDGLT